MIDLGRLLDYTVKCGASDLHLKVPSPPMVRLHGELQPVPKCPPLAQEDTERFLAEITQGLAVKQEEFAERGETDLSHARNNIGRFRVNCFRQRGSVSS